MGRQTRKKNTRSGRKPASLRSHQGQATTFVILGIVIIAVIVLLFFLRDQFLFGNVTPEKLEQRGIGPIRDHVSDCVNSIAPEYFERIGLQGGYLRTPADTFRKKDGDSVSYLCYNIEDSPLCYNRYLTRGNMEEQLEEAIRQGLSTCLNVQRFARGFEVSTGALSVGVDIGQYESLVRVDYPITLTRGSVVVKEEAFDVSFDYPLGALYDVSQDIITVETQTGEFEQLSYMLFHKGQYIIDKKKPYPDKLYILQTKDDEYIFQFFVQGEEL